MFEGGNNRNTKSHLRMHDVRGPSPWACAGAPTLGRSHSESDSLILGELKRSSHRSTAPKSLRWRITRPMAWFTEREAWRRYQSLPLRGLAPDGREECGGSGRCAHGGIGGGAGG